MSEWKTQRYEGSVGVDGRWVVSRSEAEARVENAERERDEAKEDAQMILDMANGYKDRAEAAESKAHRLEDRLASMVASENATLAAVRKEVERWWSDARIFSGQEDYARQLQERDKRILAILDGEGEG